MNIAILYLKILAMMREIAEEYFMFFDKTSVFKKINALATCALVVAALAACLPAASNATPAFKAVYEFPGVDGTYPVSSPMLASNGFVYGTTYNGGTGYGEVYKVGTSGVVTAVYAFKGTEGANPASIIVQSGPYLYGTCVDGGAHGYGSVFEIALSNGAFTLLHSFTAGTTDGGFPQSGVIVGTDGNLYGTAEVGGTGGSGAYGVIYKMNKAGTTTIVYNFSGAADGAYPFGTVYRDSSGNLITTANSGGQYGYGCVLKVTPTAVETTLHSFNYSDGANPYSGVTPDNNGGYIGTTDNGGADGDGNVYDVGVNGANFADIHDFNGDDGATPLDALADGGNGKFYGTATYGGANGVGDVFSITSTGVFAILHSFFNADGQNPRCGLTRGSDNVLRGASYAGTGEGEVYSITLSGSNGTFGIVASLPAPNGSYPIAGLTEVTPGTFIGCMDHGGKSGAGTIYTVTTAGVAKILHNFSFTDGAFPKSKLVLDNGYYYGVALAGGPAYNATTQVVGNGVIFKIKSDGTGFVVLHQFSGSDGASPFAAMAVGFDKALYGTASSGGANGDGDVFRITTAGVFKDLHDFDGSDGAIPKGDMYSSADKKLYGTTAQQGEYGCGTIYRITTTGTFNSLYNFEDGEDGYNPHAGVVEDTSGTFYGATYQGADYGYGAAYSFKPSGTSGTLTPLHEFTNGSDGGNPFATPILATDGNLYGTCESGGSVNSYSGTVYELTTTGTLTSLYSFSSGVTDGRQPFAPVTEGSDGNIYGATTVFGAGGVGVIYEIETAL